MDLQNDVCRFRACPSYGRFHKNCNLFVSEHKLHFNMFNSELGTVSASHNKMAGIQTYFIGFLIYLVVYRDCKLAAPFRLTRITEHKPPGYMQ